MANAPSSPVSALIAGQYAVDLTRPLPPLGGLACFAVTDQRTGRTDLMAVRAERRLPPRLRALQTLAVPIDGLLTPVAHGAASAPGGEEAYYVIGLAPPGPSLLARMRPWPETELLEHVVRPVALALDQLQLRGVTHRAIRLDNVFQTQPGHPVVLGAAWAAPPAVAQPALFEPPYSAMCLPAGRGDGSVADDVYALGVVLLCLALGRVPLADLDETAILHRKLELGSFAAMAGEERLPPAIADLVRGMLAEDPEHRPPPALLLDPASARSRRVAARPPQRAQRPLSVAGIDVWCARSLAYAIAADPEQGLQNLRDGSTVQWLRRGVGDGLLGARLEELIRHRALDGPLDDPRDDATLVVRAIAILDPLAPACWRGIAVGPDGIGTALAAAQDDADVTVRVQEMITFEVTGNWASVRQDRCDASMQRVEARQQHTWLQIREPAVGLARLTYLLNPLLPCASPLLRGRWVTRLPDLLPALEEASGRVDRKRVAPMDIHIAAFIAGRSERRLDNELMALASRPGEDAACLAQLRLLADLQARFYQRPLPGLAGWLAEQASPALQAWRNRDRRTAIADRMQALTRAGALASMLALIEDPAGRTADAREAQIAAAEIARIDAELAQQAAGAAERAVIADRLGQEIAAGIGLAVLATVLAVAVLG